MREQQDPEDRTTVKMYLNVDETTNKEFLDDEDWDFSEEYINQNGKAHFSSIKESNAKQVFLNQNNYSNMILDIAEVKFNKLKILGLSENRIFSIEPLVLIYMPVIEGINLFDNCITSIRPLAKVNWPIIGVLSLDDNFITDFNAIWQMHQHRGIRQIGVNFMKEILCCDSLGWFAKIGSPIFRQLWIGQYNRIIVNSVLNACRKKHQGINIVICTH